jgi:hypothetical protein
MKTPNQEPVDGKLRSLLRESRPAPELPPRFQENVWRRIEQNNHTAPALNWIEALAALVLKPRFAFATVALVLVIGSLLGSLDGTAQARRTAQDRYLEAVAMHAAH